ncbi:MAG: hypothetical protein AAGA56_01710 [Myxococcota bacterium]
MESVPTLVVEDEPVQREMMGLLLERMGARVDLARSLREARALYDTRAARYRLVVADYALLDGKVSQLLTDGLVTSRELIVTTGRDLVELPDEVTVLRKPIDVDQFREEVARRTASPRPRLTARFDDKETVDEDHPSDGAPGAATQLRLLVAHPDDPAGLRAHRRLLEALGGTVPEGMDLRVEDVTGLPEDEQVMFTPCLVRDHPRPRAWLLGDLGDRESLTKMLQDSGVDMAEGRP